MLKGLDHRLNADVLHALRAMGHGDTLIVADTNFPADSIARHTTVGRLLRMENLTTPQAIQAILTVLPLDTFDDPAGRMQVVGHPDRIEPLQADVQTIIDTAEGRSAPMIGIERYAFYEQARRAYAVIQTGETRFYGCILLRKGVIPPPAQTS